MVVEGGVACQKLSGHSQIPSTHFDSPFGNLSLQNISNVLERFGLVRAFPILLRLAPKCRIADTTRHREQDTMCFCSYQVSLADDAHILIVLKSSNSKLHLTNELHWLIGFMRWLLGLKRLCYLCPVCDILCLN